jgi:nitroreductase
MRSDMKKSILIIMLVSAAISANLLFAQQGAPSTGVITGHYATPANSFITGSIPKADLDQIIRAGVRAPSARNGQPWHFTVVQNLNLAKKIISQTVDGNALIIVSADGDGRTNGPEILDCALAVQSVYLAAQALGYGSRIYTGPMNDINKNLKTELALPRGHNAIAFVRVGRIEKTDAVSGASSRKSVDNVVTYK